MKKCVFSVVLLMLFISTTVFANISVYVNDIKLETEAEVVDNRTLVPMRSIFESLGAKVEWFNESQSILATKGSKLIALKIGINRLVVRDIESGKTIVSSLDVAPVLKADTTMVPIRAVSEALHANVVWVGETQSVYVYEEK